MGYNLFFPGVVVGPTFSFEVYLTFVQNKLEAVEKTTSWVKALMPFFITIPLAVITINLLPIFHPRWVLENKEYLQLNVLIKILLLNLVGFVYRLKFYSAWYFGQAATNLSGLSLSPSGEYDAVTAVSLKFEWEPNPRNKTEHWNASMQEWLKKVVYESLVAKLGSTGAFVGTFLISAYWHGIYLTYYAGTD
jgi:lysophospholipid acyltransferase